VKVGANSGVNPKAALVTPSVVEAYVFSVRNASLRPPSPRARGSGRSRPCPARRLPTGSVPAPTSSSSTSAGSSRGGVHGRHVRDVPREGAQVWPRSTARRRCRRTRGGTPAGAKPAAAGTCRPACRHQGQQADRLERHRLAARLGPVMTRTDVGGTSTRSTGTGGAVRTGRSSSSASASLASTLGMSSGCAPRGDRRRRPTPTSAPRRPPSGRTGRKPARHRTRSPPRGCAAVLGPPPEGVGQRQQEAAHFGHLLLVEGDDLVVDLDRRQRLEEQARPLDELPWTMPGIAERCSARTSNT